MTPEPLTLASSSPRRRQLLEMLGMVVRVRSPNIAEIRRLVDALRMLRKLQGRTHQVVTSVALVAAEALHQATDVTNVTFRRLEDAFLEAYVATGEPMDKAGAYGIQGYGAALVERIDGDFFSVMGLPIQLVLRLLEQAGHPYRFDGRAGTTEVTEAR